MLGSVLGTGDPIPLMSVVDRQAIRQLIKKAYVAQL